eukprot:5517273-Prymnesium_polylepis.1
MATPLGWERTAGQRSGRRVRERQATASSGMRPGLRSNWEWVSAWTRWTPRCWTWECKRWRGPGCGWGTVQ